MSNESNQKPAIQLEAPPPTEASVSSVGSLFADDSIAVAMNNAKFTVLEALLALLVRECKYTDFTREILLTIMRVVRAEAGTLFEVNHKNESLFFRAVVGQSSDQLEKFQVPLGQGIVGHVAESRQPVVVSNAPENKMHLKTIGNAVGFETRNLVAVPIIIRGQVYGVLELLNRLGEETFTESDVELLMHLCEYAAKAIEVRLMITWGARRAQGKTEGQAA